MKFTTRGIGWLIAGALICASSFPDESIQSMVSTIMIGLVFIAVYVMKQRFRPVGIGWFIGGGIVLAFCADLLLGVTKGIFSHIRVSQSDLSDMLIAFIIAGVCLFIFYRKNREKILDASYDTDRGYDDDDNGFSFPYQEEVFKDVDNTPDPTDEEA